MVFIRNPTEHRAATGKTAPYMVNGGSGARENYQFTPETSRRARGFTVYAALRSLGRSGITELIDRNCAQARRFAEALAAEPHIDVLNDVVLNQVMVRFRDPTGQDDETRTRTVIARIHTDGTAWAGATAWRGLTALRISVSGWNTTDADVDRTIHAIRHAASQP
jgi:glutamate/tyrosine decarboxylase-like PLP-dependent enzyme